MDINKEKMLIAITIILIKVGYIIFNVKKFKI